MSTRYKDGSHYENHQRATELEDKAAHAFRVADQHGKQDHLTGNEQSRQAQEKAEDGHRAAHRATVGHGILAFGHEDIASRAYELWQARGCPYGSPEQDWFQAVTELRTRRE